MLPRIVIDFFLNNQPDALIIQICSVIKLYMFRAPSLPIIRSFLLYVGNSISKLQIRVATYVFELIAGNCHR